jgi:sugar lactone lactonase YvrE
MTEIFATGIQMGESPRWHDGRFWMCDWLAGEVLAFSPDGSREVVARVEGLPFSIDWLPDGRLVTTTNAGVLVGRELAPYGAAGQPFNEIVVDSAGRAWVDMPGSMPWEEPRPGIVAVVLPDGTSRQVADDVWFPNGMAIVDETTLVVAESHADRLTAWTINSQGDLVDRRVWAELGEGEAPDGICVDEEGAIWYASVPGQHCVRVAEGGEVLATVGADRGCFSCMLGGDDGQTLYVVANHYGLEGASDGVVLTQRVGVPHAGRP